MSQRIIERWVMYNAFTITSCSLRSIGAMHGKRMNTTKDVEGGFLFMQDPRCGGYTYRRNSNMVT